MIEGTLRGRIVASHVEPDGTRVVDDLRVDAVALRLRPILDLHDAARCGTCRSLRDAVVRGEVRCSHSPAATECELCLLGLLP